MTAPNAPMSAEKVLAVLDADISRYQVSAEIDALTCSDESAKVLRKRVMTMIQARTAVSAMAEREAALAAELDDFKKELGRFMDIACRYKAERDALVKEVEALRDLLAENVHLKFELSASKREVKALAVRLKALESEVSARRAGWASFVDDEDPSLLVVAHQDRPVHFTGASAWDDANAIDAARAESGHD